VCSSDLKNGDPCEMVRVVRESVFR
jgi:hypothetical protein